ncbi:hypothetical protein OBJ93_07065 [Empedobacter falsenii]
MNHIKILYQKSGCKTIKEFAELVDVPKRTIEDYLYKENKLPLHIFIKVCTAIGIDFDSWFKEQTK